MAEAVSQTIEEAVGDTQQFASSVFAEIKDILNSSNSGDAKESQGSDSRDIKPADGSGSAEDRGTGLVGTLFSLGQKAAQAVDEVAQDVLELDPEVEEKLGRTLHDALLEQMTFVENPRLTQLLNKIAAPLTGSAHWFGL